MASLNRRRLGDGLDGGYEKSQSVGGWAGQRVNGVLRVRHEPHDVAGFVSNARDVPERAVEVVGVAEDDLAFLSALKDVLEDTQV